MLSFSFVSVLLCAAALFGFINYRFLRLPSSVGLLAVSLAVSLIAVGLGALFGHAGLQHWTEAVVTQANLPRTLLNGALAFMLFASAMHLEMEHLRERKWTIFLLSTAGVVVATVLFGAGIFWVFGWTGVRVPFPWCLVLGALLAPTDPVAIADTLRRVGLPATLEATIAGESMFNDGVAIVLFTLALDYAAGGNDITPARIGLDFLREAGGGLCLGLVTGYVAYLMMRQVDEYRLELMISLALASGTYSAALTVGVSGPIAVVAAGLVIGNRGRRYAMSETTEQNLDTFWGLADEILNALLFLLIGLEVVALELRTDSLIAALIAIPLSLLVRAASVVLPTLLLHLRTPNKLGGVAVLTWGGLRGGICVALALTLPPDDWRAPILLVAYAIVLFTVIVQGLTLQRVIEHFYGRRAPADAPTRRSRSAP